MYSGLRILHMMITIIYQPICLVIDSNLEDMATQYAFEGVLPFSGITDCLRQKQFTFIPGNNFPLLEHSRRAHPFVHVRSIKDLKKGKNKMNKNTRFGFSKKMGNYPKIKNK